MLILPILLLALAPNLPPQDSSGSLEAFLERARTERAEELETYAPLLEALLKQLDSKKGFSSSKVKVRSEILAMGTLIAPLLVPEIEVSIEKGTQSLQRAIEVTNLLVEMKPGGINHQLMEMAQKASVRGRRNAVEVLGHVSNPLGVRSFLIKLYRGEDAEIKVACIDALALRGGKEGSGILREALQDSDADIRKTALMALARAADSQAAPAVLDAITVPAAAASMVPEIVEYYLAVPDEVNIDAVRALGRLAIETSAKTQDCVLILRALPNFSASRKARELRKILEPLKTSSFSEIRDGALTCLYLVGDKQAKKELLRPFNERVKNDPRFYSSYTDRGEILLSIREYNDAAKDFKNALELINNNRAPSFKKTMINLARAQALAGKLKRAYDTLKDARLSTTDRKELRRDPSFEELLASSNYGKVLK